MESRARHGHVAVAAITALAAGWTMTALAAASQPPAGTAPTVGHRPAHARLPYAARLASCRRAPAVAARVASVAATMRPIRGGTHLALRISLYQRPLGAGRWTRRSDVPGLGTWTTPSDPTLGSRPADVFKYRQAVARLVVPFAYRFRVEFRWSDGAGKVVRQARTTTATCREPDLRPDLVLAHVDVAPTLRASNGARYTVTIRNDGRSAARGVLVSAAFPSDPARAATHSAGRLAAGASAVVTFLGPTCNPMPAPPSFTVDPANAIEESREGNNTAVVTVCPASAATLARR